MDTVVTTRPSGEQSADRASGPLAGKRMLFVAPDDYPPFRVDLVELFSRHLVSRGLRIDWVLRPIHTCEAHVDDRGAERYFVSRRVEAKRFARLRHRLAEQQERLKACWRVLRGDYDLVQVRDQPFWGLPFAIASRIAGTPFTFWMSYPMLEGRKRIALHNIVPMSLPQRAVRLGYAVSGSFIFYRAVLPLADHVMVQSKRMREQVSARGIPVAKMTPVPMGVTTEKFNPALIQPANDPRLDGRKSMAYMCADVMSSTARLTFEALARLVADGYDAVLVLVGRVPDFERERVGVLLDRLGVADRVIFTGRLPLAEALAYIRRVDVCLSPFEMDVVQQVATPTKLVEYLAMGRPVVATVHYDQSEVVNTSGAGIVTAFSGEAMAEGAARLFDDPGRAEAMGGRGPAWVRENRDYARLADLVERVYSGLLSKDAAADGAKDAAKTLNGAAG